ncbi:hypothetical protein HI914_03147 [Erysiphe necator]|nr:hypothetical protein HI914_03147 [Erysiphe necator]
MEVPKHQARWATRSNLWSLILYRLWRLRVAKILGIWLVGRYFKIEYLHFDTNLTNIQDSDELVYERASFR